jgi:hypothetical protein
VAGPLPTQTRTNYACAVRASTVDQALYLTLKTVEGHLARVYGKLEISSRGQLARGLGDERTRVPPSSVLSRKFLGGIVGECEVRNLLLWS